MSIWGIPLKYFQLSNISKHVKNNTIGNHPQALYSYFKPIINHKEPIVDSEEIHKLSCSSRRTMRPMGGTVMEPGIRWTQDPMGGNCWSIEPVLRLSYRKNKIGSACFFWECPKNILNWQIVPKMSKMILETVRKPSLAILNK